MTRFKELRRINAAIDHRNESELKWALGYIEMRKQFLEKGHNSHWYRIEKKVRALLAELSQKSNDT